MPRKSATKNSMMIQNITQPTAQSEGGIQSLKSVNQGRSGKLACLISFRGKQVED
jgi:hypothetical protein